MPGTMCCILDVTTPLVNLNINSLKISRGLGKILVVDQDFRYYTSSLSKFPKFDMEFASFVFDF